VPRECVYDNLRSVFARGEKDIITWNAPFVALRGHYAFHATVCTPETPREKGAGDRCALSQGPAPKATPGPTPTTPSSSSSGSTSSGVGATR
jgi:hypothetical protein